MGTVRSYISSLSLIVFGLVIALLIAEAVVRLFFPEPVLPRFVLDSGYGIRTNEPNVVTRHYVPGDYDITVTTNSVGMRGVGEYTVTKKDGICRVAVIGDSFIFGFGVNDEEVISNILENELNKSVDDKRCRYEVINLSVSGFGQAEQLVMYRNEIRKYDPDDVVLFYYSNDIGNNAVSQLFEVDENGGVHRTESEYLPGVKVREILYGVAPMRWLFTHSQAWNYIRNRLSELVQKSLLKKQGLKTFREPKPAAVELTRKLLLQFIADIREDGARATLFVIPTKRQITNFPLTPDEVLDAEAYFVDGKDFLVPDDYYNRDDHWRAKGHRKAARELSRLISENQ